MNFPPIYGPTFMCGDQQLHLSHNSGQKSLKSTFRWCFEGILDYKTLPEHDWKRIWSDFIWFWETTRNFFSDASCKHSEDTPEVAFAYFCGFRARLRQWIKHLKNENAVWFYLTSKAKSVKLVNCNAY